MHVYIYQLVYQYDIYQYIYIQDNQTKNQSLPPKIVITT